MAATLELATVLERAPVEAPRARPVARWVEELDASGRRRLVMVWSVPEPVRG